MMGKWARRWNRTCISLSVMVTSAGSDARRVLAEIALLRDAVQRAEQPQPLVGDVQNGIAPSTTCHWLFDRHFISLSHDYGLLVSHNRVPNEFRNLFEKQVDRIHLPADERLWPRPEFVTRHRERFAGHTA